MDPMTILGIANTALPLVNNLFGRSGGSIMPVGPRPPMPPPPPRPRPMKVRFPASPPPPPPGGSGSFAALAPYIMASMGANQTQTAAASSGGDMMDKIMGIQAAKSIQDAMGTDSGGMDDTTKTALMVGGGLAAGAILVKLLSK